MAASLVIIIPTHNRPALVLRAVMSALQTTPSDAKILVVDDASDPPAEQALAGVLAVDPRLQVIRIGSSRGAAAARNYGVSAATGDVVLFLDDDDELIPGYAARVLYAATQPDGGTFGFCAIVARSAVVAGDTIERRRYRTGVLPDHAPLRHRIAALSAGFWIRRNVFLASGGFAEDQIVDEDTSLCCSLAAKGLRPWYDDEPGVVVYRDHSPTASAAAQLTRATRQDIVVACYLRTWQRHAALFPAFSEARWFLATRYLRRAVKAGHLRAGWQMARTAQPMRFSLGLIVFWTAKVLGRTIRPGFERTRLL